jgi:tetratricopeptide (TPR) repeat protein
MTTAPQGALPEDAGGGFRVEMRGEAHDWGTFTQIGTQINQPPPLPAEAFRPWAELAVPPGLANLPARPGLFVGRTEELARLNAALAGPGGVVAVHGLGGIGKSTLAAHWAAAHASDYTLTWWITAATPAEIDSGLAALAAALQPALSGVLPLEALREGAVQWLAAHQEWLLVLDNVTGPADVAPLLARAAAGRCLITSRRATGWYGSAASIPLNVLADAEAADVLTEIVTHYGPRDLDGIAELCEELGYLPLAIEQAGAFIAETGTTPREYLALLDQYPSTMYRASAEGGDASRTIARIWDVTLDRLAGEPLPGRVLRVLAWYAPDAIPRSLLGGQADPPALLTALGRLAAYSMLTVTEGTLAMHRLVQAVARTPDPDIPHRNGRAIDQARDMATILLAAAVPRDPVDPSGWTSWRALLPHIGALASHVQPQADTVVTAWMLNAAGVFLHIQGAVSQAIAHHERVLAASTRIFGDDSPSTLASRYNLAADYHAAGDFRRAVPLYERALADSTRVLGGDSPQTLDLRSNLAGAYQQAGDLARAIPLLEQVLADSVRVLGDDHPDTLTSRSNLADAYRSAGDLDRALSLNEQALAGSVRVLGEDHPQTPAFRQNVAAAYSARGDLGRAIPLYEQALAGSARVLGEDHPQTLTSRSNLAGAYESAGDLGRAIPLLEQMLSDRQRILGDDHPDTLTSRNNLASALAKAGDLDQAIPLFEHVLSDRERILGDDHPDALSSRDHLAGAYESAGDLVRAIRLYKQVVSDRERILGSDHPRTLTSRSNVAYTYQAADNLGRAIPLFEQVLSDRERILGDDHPDTLTSRNNLASALAKAGDLDQAIPLLEQALSDRQRILGDDHPDTLASRGNVASAYLLAGDLISAIPMFEQVLSDHQRILGEDYPQTLTARSNLASAYQRADDLARAIPLYEQALADSARILGPDHPKTQMVRRVLAAAREQPQ